MFQVKPHEPNPLRWWYEQRETIDMSPSYQREGELWSKPKKALLINSILNDYDIPKIYLADFTYVSTPLNEDKKPYAVIDGKQRLEALFGFFANDFSLAKDFKYDTEPSLDLGGCYFGDLKRKHPTVADKIERYVPTVMSVISDEEDKIDELFVRLNSGLEVNGAERRNAMRGPVPKIIRKLVRHEFFISKISFDVKRMAQYNAAAKILLIEYRDGFTDTKAGNLDRFVKETESVDIRVFQEIEKRIRKVFNEMSGIFIKKDALLNTAGPIPIYYWLAKNHSEKKDSMRDFLESFSKKLKENFELTKEDPRSGNAELNEYYRMMRTTNDKESLTGRYKILEKRFKRYTPRG